eukprot:808382-Amphidinium_carterae.1
MCLASRAYNTEIQAALGIISKISGNMACLAIILWHRGFLLATFFFPGLRNWDRKYHGDKVGSACLEREAERYLCAVCRLWSAGSIPSTPTPNKGEAARARPRKDTNPTPSSTFANSGRSSQLFVVSCTLFAGAVSGKEPVSNRCCTETMSIDEHQSASEDKQQWWQCGMFTMLA